MPRYKASRPRNVTASREEIWQILSEVKLSVKLWLLFCSDMALRSGTANRISGENYDRQRGVIRFVSKGESKQTMPVTEEIAKILEPLDDRSKVPYVWQIRAKEHRQGRWPEVYDPKLLRKELRETIKKLGIKRIIPHDLRRTTAVAVLEGTGDIREVQSVLGHSDLKTTLWYLDHDAVKVTRSTLEKAKLPFIAWRKEKSA
ncbi:MAG: tyrosine-type recombinase/integrase [Terracidiphilus sp.]